MIASEQIASEEPAANRHLSEPPLPPPAQPPPALVDSEQYQFLNKEVVVTSDAASKASSWNATSGRYTLFSTQGTRRRSSQGRCDFSGEDLGGLKTAFHQGAGMSSSNAESDLFII